MHQLSRTRTWLVGLLSACLTLAGLSLSPLQAAAETTITPVGTWLPTEFGQVRITSTTPELTGTKTAYNVGEVVTVRFRMESNADAPARTIVATSNTLTNAGSCSWGGAFPGGTGGKYDCARIQGGTQFPQLTYTITEADAEAGQAIFDLTWTETPAGGAARVTTIHGALPVTQAEPEPVDILDVSLTRTDSLGDEVRVGDVVTYSITYTNKSGAAFTAFPRTSNLDGVLPPAVPNCRWANLGAGATATCPTASHTITQADLDAGSFTGTVTYDATSDREGTVVLQAGVTATAAPITITDAPAPPRAEGEYVTLASAGYAGFTCHRIPALTQANNGWLLASWDGRPGGCADAPQANSIVQRISKDGGQTWEESTTIAAGRVEAPKYGYSDPSYVVDRETGDIFNFFVKSFDQGWAGSVAGTDPENRNVIHAAYIKSEDNGATWSEPVVITEDITNDPAWRSRFAASGEGIQLRYGDHAGRLIQQYTINNGGVVQAVSVYSDDHGATWHAGTPVGTGMDENKTVELSDGRVMLNSRAPGTGARKIAISDDGGETYGPVYIDYALIDPTNNASITRAFPNAPEGSAKAKMLLFSNAANTGSRSNGTIRLSYDDGQTWSVAKVFEPGAMSYSTLTPLDYGPDAQPGVYGLLFEGTSSTIRYMQVSLDWLGGLPVAVTAEAQTVNRGENTVTYTVTNVSDEDLTGLVVTPAAPTGWTAAPSAAFDLAAGAERDVTIQVTAPDWADAGSVNLPVSVGNDDGESQGTAQLTLELLPGQNPAETVPVQVVGTLPAQSGQGQGNMFDGNVSTLWHTPWSQDMELPLDIDLTVGETPRELAYLSMTPRQSGVNGRITQYEIYAGDSLDDLTKIGEGTLANSASTKLIPLDTTARFVRFRVLEAATDSGTQFVSIAELSVKAAVADDPAVAPELSDIADQTSVEGEAITPIAVTATGTAPSITVTGLPAGLTYADGEITGTPTTAGASTVTVTATNSAGTDSLTFTYTVTAQPVDAPVLSPIDDATIELGSAVSITASATGDDVTYSADGLPTGVALNPETGAITGTPTAVGSGTVTVTATNDGGSDSEAFVLSVRDTTAPVAAALGNVSVQVGSSVSVQVTATDLTELTYSATGLPAGVEIDAETGLISGAPTAAGTSPVTVLVADASGNETERTFTLTVTAAPVVDETGPVIAPIAAASSMVGASVHIAVQATDPSTPLSYSATGLPSGVRIHASTGVISGSPQAAGTFTVRVLVTDAKGNSTAASFTMTVAPATDPVPEFPRSAPYTLPGEHHINGRDWRTVCERYSQTERCRTEIWASVVKRTGNTFTIERGWAFNNLTYLPFMKREQWANNPLGHTATWIGTDGAQWRTECDTELSGPNACRSFRWTTVYTATKGDDGRYEFGQENKWVFNNIVMFGSYGR